MMIRMITTMITIITTHQGSNVFTGITMDLITSIRCIPVIITTTHITQMHTTTPVQRFTSISEAPVTGTIVIGAGGTGGTAGITIMPGIMGACHRTPITTLIITGVAQATIIGADIMDITLIPIITTTTTTVVLSQLAITTVSPIPLLIG